MTDAAEVGGPDLRLAEVIAVQASAVPATAGVRVVLGTADLEDGQDESSIHARLVELLDLLLERMPADAITVVGFPRVPEQLRALRSVCEASARVTAELRGIRFESAP